MKTEIFADGVSAVHLTGNLVRIDLMTVQPHLKSKDGQPVVDISQRVIMPLDGFIKALQVQQNLVKQLVENGTLKLENREANAGESATAATVSREQ